MRRFVTPVIAEVELRQLCRLHFAKVLEAAHRLGGLPPAALPHRPWWPKGWRRPCCWVLRAVHWRAPAGDGPARPGSRSRTSPPLGHSTVRVTQDL